MCAQSVFRVYSLFIYLIEWLEVNHSLDHTHVLVLVLVCWFHPHQNLLLQVEEGEGLEYWLEEGEVGEVGQYPGNTNRKQ